jgi:hypothetical protein
MNSIFAIFPNLDRPDRAGFDNRRDLHRPIVQWVASSICPVAAKPRQPRPLKAAPIKKCPQRKGRPTGPSPRGTALQIPQGNPGTMSENLTPRLTVPPPRFPSSILDVNQSRVGRLTRRPTISMSVSAYAQPTFCRMPPDNFFAKRSAKGSKPVLCRSSEIRHSRSALARRGGRRTRYSGGH